MVEQAEPKLPVPGAPCLGVIIPAYNEAATVKEALGLVLAQACVLEAIVVDDGSVDSTASLVRDCATRHARITLLQHASNRGKGAAIRTGLAQTTAPLVIIQDADLEYEPNDYARLIEPILRGDTNVVYGSRFMPGSRTSTTCLHRAQNRALTMAANFLTGLRLTDEATCYKVFRREVLQGLALRENHFGFCPEATAKLSRMGVKVLEVPIAYTARSRSAGKKLRLRDGLDALRCLLKYRFSAQQRPTTLAHALDHHH